MGKLERKVAVVTGAARGIGRGIAFAFAREGAAVGVADLNADGARGVAKEIAKAGARSLPITADVTNEAAAARMFDEILAEFGRIDILVNNAGIASGGMVRDLSLADWERILKVDLTGVFLACRAVLPTMIAQGSGRIINIGSQLGLRGAPGLAHYCAAKGGVHAFTKSLAYEVAELGITVNAIAPGPTSTDMLATIPTDVLEGIRQEVPLKRFARIEEIVPTAVLLASDEGGYYTGSILNVSGGHAM